MKIDFKKFLSFKKEINIEHKNCISPHEGWKILIRVMMVICIILIIFSLYLFFNIKNDQIFKAKEIDQVKTEIVNQEKLDKISNIFKQKEENLEKLKNGEISFKDPS